MARLSREKWLDHALAHLTDHGFTSLKADTLAKSLGVSRGSFYWHFEDLAAFHAAVLDHWLQVSVLGIVEEIESAVAGPADRLRSLVEVAAAGNRELERAIRAWSLADASVKATVELVDAERIAYIVQLLKEMKVPKREQGPRALQLYLTSLGYWMVSDVISEKDTRSVIESVLALAGTIDA